MAGLWCEHFQEYADETELLDGVFAQASGFTIESSAIPPPRAGAKYLYSNLVSNTLRRIFGAAKAGAGFGCRIYVSSLPPDDASGSGGSGPSWCFKAASGVTQIVVFLGSDGGLIVCRGPWSPFGGGFTVLGRSAPVVTARTWQFMEFKHVPATVGGSFEVRVNGATAFSYTGNTNPAGTAETSQMAIQSENSKVIGIADLFAWDTSGAAPTDFVGNCAVLRRELNADTAVAAWTKSTGSTGYPLLIDQDDATYIQSDVVAQKSAFGAGALPAGASGIAFQQVKFRSEKTNAADCSVAASLISGVAETAVAGQATTELATWRWSCFGLDPATSAPWTPSGANASKPAVTRTA